MAIAWFICGYKRDTTQTTPTRYCAMDDFTALIEAGGGAWSETEVLGGHALVKVRATTDTLNTIAAATGFVRIPKAVKLTDSLSTLSTAQRNVLRNKIESMGYTLAELQAAVGTNLANVTLGQILRFAASRRLKPRYDVAQDQIVLDGEYQSCRPVADVDAAVTE